MAKFTCDFSSFELEDGRHGSTHAEVSGSGSFFSELSAEDIISILRPAAEALRDAYKATLSRLFKRRSGSLVDSIQIYGEFNLDRAYMDLSEASITVGPRGKRRGKRGARSRAGSSERKYAKHGRDAHTTTISNAELAYLFEFGTPRIAATHWMENTNEEVGDQIQQIMEDSFNECMKKKGM